MPAGGLLEANNVRADHPGSLTPRPGQSPLLRFGDPANIALNLSGWLTGVMNWNAFYQLGDGLYPSWVTSANLWAVLNTNIVNATASSAAAPVYGFDTELFSYNVNTPTARGVAWNTNAYVNFKNGVGRIHVQSQVAKVTPAGIPQAAPPIVTLIDPISLTDSGTTVSYISGSTYQLPLNGSAIEALGVAAYQLLYMRTDYDATVLLGPPSVQAQVNNVAQSSSTIVDAPVWVYTGSYTGGSGGPFTAGTYALPCVVWEQGVSINIPQVTGVMQVTSGSLMTFVAGPDASGLVLTPGVNYGIAVLYQAPNPATSTTSSGVQYYTTTLLSGAPNTSALPFTSYLVTASSGTYHFLTGGVNVWQGGTTNEYGVKNVIVSAGVNVIAQTGSTASTLTVAWTVSAGLDHFPPNVAFVQGQPIFLGYTGVGFVVNTASQLSMPQLTMSSPNPPTLNASFPLAGDSITVTDALGNTSSGEVISGSISAFTTSLTAAITAVIDTPTAAIVYDPITTGSQPSSSWNTTQSALAVAAEWEQYGAISLDIVWAGPRNVFLELPYDQWLHNLAFTDSSDYEAFSYQVYRSVNNATIDSTGTIPPASQAADLLQQALLPTTSVSSSTAYLSYFDQTPDTALGAALYTSPAQGGQVSAQYPPPPCADLALLNNVMLYANIAQPANMQLQLVGVSSTASITSFQQLQPGDLVTLTYAPATSESASTVTLTAGTDFALVTSSGPSANLNQTIINFTNAINEKGLYSPMTGSLIGFPIQIASGEPGLFALAVTQGLGTISMEFQGSTAPANANILTQNEATCGDITGTASEWVLYDDIGTYQGTSLSAGSLSVVTTVPGSAPLQGTKCLHYTETTGNTSAGATLNVTVLPSTNYVFSAWYYSTSGGFVRIEIVNNVGAPVAFDQTVAANTWTRLQVSYGPFSSTTNLQIGLNWVGRSVGTHQDYYLDEWQLEIGTSATTWVLPGGPVSHSNPFVGGPASGLASPTFLPSTVGYSQANIPDGAPVFNTVPVGTTTYPIRRILTCQAGTFIFKDDGIFQLSGVYGNYNVTLLSGSARLVADNTAVVLQDSVIALTSAGVVLVNSSGIQVTSQAIRDDLLRLMKLSSIKYAFAVADQQRSHYMLWLCSAANLTQPDLCYVYNTLNNSWVLDRTSRQVGLVELESGTLYMGAAPGTEPIGLLDSAQMMVEFAEGAAPDFAAMADDIWSGFSVAAGANPNQLVISTSVSSATGAFLSTLATALNDSLPSIYAAGAVFDSLDNQVPIVSASWLAVASVQFPPGPNNALIVTATIDTTPDFASTVALMVAADAAGGAFVGAAIPVSFQAFIAGDDAGHVKLFQEFTLQARNTTQLQWTTSQSSDFGFADGAITLQAFQASKLGLPAVVGWAAANVPVTTTQYAAARNFVARDCNRGHVLYTTFSANVAATTFEVLTLTFNWQSTATTTMR